MTNEGGERVFIMHERRGKISKRGETVLVTWKMTSSVKERKGGGGVALTCVLPSDRTGRLI